jgi:hypothetical protein
MNLKKVFLVADLGKKLNSVRHRIDRFGNYRDQNDQGHTMPITGETEIKFDDDKVQVPRQLVLDMLKSAEKHYAKLLKAEGIDTDGATF